MAVANSVTNPFVVLLFNVKWPCAADRRPDSLAGTRLQLSTSHAARNNDTAVILRCARPTSDTSLPSGSDHQRCAL